MNIPVSNTTPFGRLALWIARAEALTASGAANQSLSAAERARASVRLRSIDVLRGLLIVLMVFDHISAYFLEPNLSSFDIPQPVSGLLAARWLTQACAPIFILLAGLSAALSSRRLSKMELSRLLVTRGLSLVLLDLALIVLAWLLHFDPMRGSMPHVVWAIGMSMIVLAALVHLPVRVVGIVGVALCCLHTLFEALEPSVSGMRELIPAVGVIAIGYALGSLYDLERNARRRLFALLGLVALVAFFVFHAINIGPGLLALAGLESTRTRAGSLLETFGGVPLFFYVTHLLLAHLGAGLVALATGFGTGVLENFMPFFPKAWGLSLGAAVLAWLVVLAILYPACGWFAALKRRRRAGWLFYL